MLKPLQDKDHQHPHLYQTAITGHDGQLGIKAGGEGERRGGTADEIKSALHVDASKRSWNGGVRKVG